MTVNTQILSLRKKIANLREPQKKALDRENKKNKRLEEKYLLLVKRQLAQRAKMAGGGVVYK